MNVKEMGSPSLHAQARGCGKVLLLGGKQGRGPVGHHVVYGAGTGQFNFFVTQWVGRVRRVILMVARERNGCMIVGKQIDRGLGVAGGG